MIQRQQGVILVSVLLLVAIFSALILSTLYASLLQVKMSHFDKQRALEFLAAEKELTQLEQDLTLGRIGTAVTVIPCDLCGVRFYRVTAQNLQSTFVVLQKVPCREPPTIKPGRQSWRSLE